MSTMTTVIFAALDADVPVLLWGPPGVGKSAMIEAMAERAGAKLVTLIASQLDPTDVGGLPVPDADGVVQLSLPPWGRQIVEALDEDREVWLFLDELSCAPPSVQAALLRVVHDREVAGRSIRGGKTIAAANPADSAADGGWLSPPMSGRFCHVQHKLEPKDWVEGQLVGWGKPMDMRTSEAAVSVCGWITRNPGALLGESKDNASPSPRTWTAGIKMLGRLPGGPDDAAAVAVLGSCVGAPAALEWATYHKQRDLPDPELLLAGTVPMPTRGDSVLAAALAVVAVANHDRPDRRERMLTAAERLAGLRPDVSLTPARAWLAAMDNEVPDCLLPLAEIITSARSRIAA